MKRFFSILIPVIIILFTKVTTLSAQGPWAHEDDRSIFEALQRVESGKGEVIINQPFALRNMVGRRQEGQNVETTDGSTYLNLQGYRVQVFSGNDQRVAKDEAFKKEKEIKELYSHIPTYVTYTAPFWRLRVGDFRSNEEAYHLLRLLKEAFPSYAKEMYIVREDIKLQLY
ncbi:SPOR domain-containing protein [Parabacteroides sp. PF5-9]|uniref:SPOR domain-containing protein n=1 Tax=Parabacteroides sp. PF5-9 TaxID=1742404 RepID=UPI002476FD5B|nr:SPOR domain-containing protein [Parabacteroides sp. PF5-9]MDH6356750.1 hypothetical protein [Parabacteroides sp. PF5-9]